VLNYGMARLQQRLASLYRQRGEKTLDRTARGTPRTSGWGRSRAVAADASTKSTEKDRAKYEEDRARDIRLGATTGIDAALKAHNLDALLFPGAASAGIASKPGYPTVLVPFGMVPNVPGNPGGGGGRGRGQTPPSPAGTAPAPPAPAGTTPAAAAPSGPPAGDGPGDTPSRPAAGVRRKTAAVWRRLPAACSEPTLLRLAYAFEQATKKRTPPPGLR
jgi:hypothetical protein